MAFETELLEITSENFSEAKFMASSFINLSVRNRVFFNVIGAEAVISYLGKLGIDIENISSIHSIKRVVEKIDISDVILDNIHIDVRVIFNEREIFIPKSHFELGVVPDIYAILKYDKSYQRIIFIGYIVPAEIDWSISNNEYYFVDSEKLHSPFDMFDFIKGFSGKTNQNIGEAKILRGRELSVLSADNDMSNEEFKEFLSLLIKSNSLRNSVLEYDNFETLAMKVAAALRVSKSKSKPENTIVDLDDFMNMPKDTLSEEVAPSDDGKEDIYADPNGDDMLDSPVEDTAETVSDVINTIAENTNADDFHGAEAASKEVIDLAGIAGESLVDSAEGLLEDENDNLTDWAEDTEIVEENNSELATVNNFEELETDTQEEKNDIEDTNVETDESGDALNSEDSLDLGSIELKEEELDFSDFELDKDIQISDSLTNDDALQASSELTSTVSSENECLSQNDNSEEEQNLKNELAENVTEAQTEESVSQEIVSAEPEENSDNEDENLNIFDIGENLDIDNVSAFSDEFADNDYDFGNPEEIPTGEINDEIVITEKPSEKIDSDDVSQVTNQSVDAENTEILEDISAEVVTSNDSESIQDVQQEDVNDSTQEDKEETDDGIQEIEDSSADKDNPFELAEHDEIFDENTEPHVFDNTEAGDDDLLVPSEEENKIDEYTAVDFETDIPEDTDADKSLFVPNETVDSVDNMDNYEEVHNFEELPTEEIDEHPQEKDYGLVNFSDLADVSNPEQYNVEVNFADVEDFDSFETIAPIEDGAKDDFIEESYTMEDILNQNTVKENSVLISDKSHNPGEIFIDINKDSSKVDITSSNEHLEELYNKNNTVISDDNGLNNDVMINRDKGKMIPLALGIGGIALIIIVAGIIMLSVSKFMNPSKNENEPLITDNIPQNNNLGEDVPNLDMGNNSNIIMNENSGQTMQQNANNEQNRINQSSTESVQVQHASQPIPATSFLSVRKLSWEVPDYISVDTNFRQYFQSAGKSLKAGLSSDLLLATDYAYSDQIRVSILYTKEGMFQRAKILLSSGSAQIDNIVLQSVNQTLKVLKAPASLGNDQSTTVILKIYL